MIYFENADKASNVKELLTRGFNYPNGSVYAGSYFKFSKTFRDKDFLTLECEEARRSFMDLYEIAITYFPNTTKEEFAYILLNMDNVISFYCPILDAIIFQTCVPYKGKNKFKFDRRMGERYNETFEGLDGLSFYKIKELSNKYVQNRNTSASKPG